MRRPPFSSNPAECPAFRTTKAWNTEKGQEFITEFFSKNRSYKNLHYAQQVKGQRIFLYSSCKHWTKSSKRLLLSIFIREYVLSNALLNAKIVWNSEYFLQSFIDKYFLWKILEIFISLHGRIARVSENFLNIAKILFLDCNKTSKKIRVIHTRSYQVTFPTFMEWYMLFYI